MKKLIILTATGFILIGMYFLFVFSCEKVSEKTVLLPTPSKDICEKDSDCVPAQCCHPVSCINKEFAPECKGIMCTMNCQPGTMDCGQGVCVCKNNRCQVEWKSHS